MCNRVLVLWLLLGRTFGVVGDATTILEGRTPHSFRHWVGNSGGAVDLSTTTFRPHPKNPHPTVPDNWYVGIALGPSSSGYEDGWELSCCTHLHEHSFNKCDVALNQPFLAGPSANLTRLVYAPLVSKSGTVSFPISLPVNESGYYTVDIIFCLGSYVPRDEFPRLEMTGGPHFVSKSWFLPPSLRVYMALCGVVTVFYGMASIWLMKRCVPSGRQPQCCTIRQIPILALAILVVSGCEAMLRCVDLFLVNYLNHDETPLIGWTNCFRTVRVGLLSVYVLALSYGSGLFRREVVHERWIVLIGSSVASVFLGSSWKKFGFNIEALVAVPLLMLSMIFSFARSWKYLRRSQVAHHHIVAYRRQLCYLICFGILFPAVYLGWGELRPHERWYVDTRPSNLPNWTWWWERIVFWQWNSLWFITWSVLPWVEEPKNGETINHWNPGNLQTQKKKKLRKYMKVILV